MLELDSREKNYKARCCIVGKNEVSLYFIEEEENFAFFYFES